MSLITFYISSFPFQPYKCTVCDRGFMDKQKVDGHMKRVHRDKSMDLGFVNYNQAETSQAVESKFKNYQAETSATVESKFKNYQTGSLETSLQSKPEEDEAINYHKSFHHPGIYPEVALLKPEEEAINYHKSFPHPGMYPEYSLKPLANFSLDKHE